MEPHSFPREAMLLNASNFYYVKGRASDCIYVDISSHIFELHVLLCKMHSYTASNSPDMLPERTQDPLILNFPSHYLMCGWGLIIGTLREQHPRYYDRNS